MLEGEMVAFRVSLREVADNQAAIERCFVDDALRLYGSRSDPRYWLVTDLNDNDLGVLPRSGKLMEAVLDGAYITAVSVQRVIQPTDKKPSFGLSVNVELTLDAPSGGDKSYPVGIVGEAHHQPAIAACVINEEVTIAYERGNPFDSSAIVVLNRYQERIGYIGRQHWLRDAIEEGKGCAASIGEITLNSQSGVYGVVLQVELDRNALPIVDYVAHEPARERPEISSIVHNVVTEAVPSANVSAHLGHKSPKREWLRKILRW